MKVSQSAGPSINCEGEHGLKPYSIPKTTYSCDVCKKKMKKGELALDCRTCNFDACKSCAVKAAHVSLSVNCEGKHGLTAFLTPHESFNCDVCKKRMKEGDFALGCRTCDFDMCESCAVKAKSPGTGFI